MANLVSIGKYQLHSGGVSNFKIDCDALSDQDIEAVAFLLSKRVKPFQDTYPIHGGGYRIGGAINKFKSLQGLGTVLLVDDVLTTGASLEKSKSQILKARPKLNVIGTVIFACGPCPDWVTPLFTMDGKEHNG